MTTLKTYQADELKNEQMNAESEDFRVVTMKVLTMQLNSIIIMDFIAYGGAALGIGMACNAFVHKTLGLSACVFMILLSADFFLPMRRLGSYFHVAMNGMAASDKIFRFLSEPEPGEKTVVLPVNGGDIEVEDVHFSYIEDQEVLHGVNLSVPEHSFVGIVGESGSGKSTVASLLMGRNTPTSGRILIGGCDLQSVSESSLLEKMTYVGLGSVFFKGSVRDNLLLSDPSAGEDKLWPVLTDCGIEGFLRSEQGLDTQLLANAGNLSGGQKQR
ncbi:MAG: ATP-binding cassette domain-containing protein, partial [Oscillospiraceae bacterium]|nr:ATP-binding cassette domain-containing protein [Oscillospiraceae bacterium]